MHDETDNDWLTVLIAVLAGVIAAVHYGKVAPALPTIRADLPMSMVLAGWVVSVFSFTGAVLGIGVGSVSDRLGARRLACAGLLTLCAGSILGALAGHGDLLLLSRFCEGLGFIAVAVSAPVLIVRSVNADRRSLALGLWTAYMPLGMALAMLILPLLLDQGAAVLHWRELWGWLTALTLLWTLLVWRVVPADAGHRQETATSLLQHLIATLRSPGSWLMAAAFAGYTLQWISLMSWLPTFLLEEKALSAAATAGLTAAVVLCNIPGNLSVGWLLQRGIRRDLILYAGGLGMGCFAFAVLTPALPDGLRLLAVLLFSFCGGLIPGVVLASAPVVAPSAAQIGTVNGMMVQGAHLGQLLGPPALAAVVGLRQDWGDSRWLMLTAALAICLTAWLYRRHGPNP